MGLVSAAVIARWSYGLVFDMSQILLDSAVDEQTQSTIKKAIERDSDNRISDMHKWYVGPHHYSASMSVVTHHPKSPEHYKFLLQDIPRLAHVLVEVNQCPGKSCVENAT